MHAFETGAEAFLRQAHRNNWQRYVASLQPDAPTGWDVCVLTASNERQAGMYRRQLDLRAEAGLLPARMRFRVISDPEGRRIGSGGATLRVLSAMQASEGDVYSTRRVLIIHSGGDSRRLPHCSAIGKLFARIPRALPDGRASTLFDEFLISLSGVAAALSPGVLVASGDVLLLFDHLQLQLQHRGVSGVAIAAPAEMGTRHGVYVRDRESLLRAYLHKADEDHLRQWEAISGQGTVDIDTGLVWLDAPTVRKLVALAREPAIAPFCSDHPNIEPPLIGLNLYGDLLLPLARSTTFEGYLADTSDGPATPAIRAARKTIWRHLRDVPFAVERLQPAAFLHFGTSQEYWSLLSDTPSALNMYGWTSPIASWLGEQDRAACEQVTAIQAVLSPQTQDVAGPTLIIDSDVRGALHTGGPALIANVSTDREVALHAGTVLHQLPLPGGFVTRVYGLSDDPKHPYRATAASFMNRPWDEWLSEARISAEDLWPGIPDGERTLWNAQLYPLAEERDESLLLSLPLQAPGNASPDWWERWWASRRLSLADSFVQADGERILQDQTAVEDEVAVRCFCAAIEAEQPAAEARMHLGARERACVRRARRAAAWMGEATPLVRLRGYKALEVVTGEQGWEDKAFDTLAEMIEDAVSRQRLASSGQRSPIRAGYTETGPVQVKAAARIDFGGGWTDTPPYSIERGGTVLNAAITLQGRYPITAEAEWLPEPRLVLESRDIRTAIELASLGEVLAYANPTDPFALLKAAIVLRGLVPTGGDPERPLAGLMPDRGLRLHTQTQIPRGSGLGTSSILAGAVLACLARLQGVELAQAQLFDEVLCLEQMMTTGGGWQDQVGGLTGGIKLVSTAPGLPQRIEVAPVHLSPETEAKLSKRLLLVYTGQQRLAKNLLQRVMGRWMARDPEMVRIQSEIARLALEMRDALQKGDVDRFGALLSEHWVQNRRMEAGCMNPFLDELFEAVGPYINGCKLAGAGGGGFAIVVARDGDAAQELSAMLGKTYAGTPVSVWPCAVPATGMVAS